MPECSEYEANHDSKVKLGGKKSSILTNKRSVKDMKYFFHAA